MTLSVIPSLTPFLGTRWAVNGSVTSSTYQSTCTPSNYGRLLDQLNPKVHEKGSLMTASLLPPGGEPQIEHQYSSLIAQTCLQGTPPLYLRIDFVRIEVLTVAPLHRKRITTGTTLTRYCLNDGPFPAQQCILLIQVSVHFPVHSYRLLC